MIRMFSLKLAHTHTHMLVCVCMSMCVCLLPVFARASPLEFECVCLRVSVHVVLVFMNVDWSHIQLKRKLMLALAEFYFILKALNWIYSHWFCLHFKEHQLIDERNQREVRWVQSIACLFEILWEKMKEFSKTLPFILKKIVSKERIQSQQ